MPMPSICETFTLDSSSDDARIVRNLSIGGMRGVSWARVDASALRGSSQNDLEDAWDRSFLAGAVEYPSEDRSGSIVRIADVFCGAGGLSYGVREAARACGMRPVSVMAADVDSVALEVYRRNFDPKYHSTRNVWTSVTHDYTSRRSRFGFTGKPRIDDERLTAAVGKVDILLGGPPCEGHSSSNNRTRRADPRNKYYIAMPALAVALGAEAVIVENVPGIQHDKTNVLEQAKKLFESEGWMVSEDIANAVALGLPQTRKRHILIASKTRRPDIASALEAFARPPRDLRWVIGDLNDIEPESPMDTGAQLSEENRRRIDHLFDTGEYDLQNEFRPESHRYGHTYPSIYGRLRWEKPSGTITTGFGTPGRGRYIHPEKRRTLTQHEAARIQGFPDTFEFALINGETPTRTNLASMIGDAVPPQIGYAAGAAALASMSVSITSGASGAHTPSGAD